MDAVASRLKPAGACMPTLAGDLRPLLAGFGRLYSEELDIDVSSRRPLELYRWFLAAQLFGARIAESVAVRTFRAFGAHQLVTPELVATAEHSELLQIMAEGGYVRYDGITSRKVQGAARKLIAEYGGDLNQLHEASADGEEVEQRLMAFWGVGHVTANIFLRELRGVWRRADPALGPLASLAAQHLGVEDFQVFWAGRALVGYDVRHFEAALTRIGKDFCRRGRCSMAPIPHEAPGKAPAS